MSLPACLSPLPWRSGTRPVGHAWGCAEHPAWRRSGRGAHAGAAPAWARRAEHQPGVLLGNAQAVLADSLAASGCAARYGLIVALRSPPPPCPSLHPQ